MQLRGIRVFGSMAVLVALLGAPRTSLAHERRTIAGGKYDVVIGWDSEPAFANQKNAAGIRLSRAGTNPAEPVTGAEKTLQFEVHQGGLTRSFDLRVVFGQPGYYVADILPTRAGDYVWIFSGAIGAEPVNETFDSAERHFDGVVPTGDSEFPTSTPDPAQLNASLEAVRSATESARSSAFVAIGLGAISLLAAAGVWLARARG